MKSFLYYLLMILLCVAGCKDLHKERSENFDHFSDKVHENAMKSIQKKVAGDLDSATYFSGKVDAYYEAEHREFNKMKSK